METSVTYDKDNDIKAALTQGYSRNIDIGVSAAAVSGREKANCFSAAAQ